MSRTRTLQNRPRLPSLTLITAAIAAVACSSKVQLGDATDAGPIDNSGTGGGTSIRGGVGGAPASVGGNTAAAGTPATGGATTTFQRQANNAITGIDLLLMIDNSSSMADKQVTLANAVPQLLGQLIQPNCVDASGNSLNPAVAATLGAANPCPAGSSPEFNPVNNIHIGVVTSSLGDHGAGALCTPGHATQYTDPGSGAAILQPPDVNDMSHLVGTLARFTRTGTDTTYSTLNSGFLAWGDATLPNPGQADLSAANVTFRDMVSAVHESGCGFESQLESWFRFLVDPVPPVLPLLAPDVNSQTHRTGSDDTLLNQRAAFLRPDSLVAIVMLTDENDCSIRDTDVGWVSADTTHSIPTGSAQCQTNPNDKCCYSCTATAPSGCANTCPANNDPRYIAVDDGPYQANLRCWEQKRRFGYEFLYPTSRYVVGLTKPVLCPDQTFGDMDCDCTYAKSIGAACDPGSRQMPNPLYSTVVGALNNGQPIAGYPNSIARSDNSGIFLAGIVGVPWQDLGYADANGNLNYIPLTDPAWVGAATTTPPVSAGSTGIWDQIYGDDNANITPHDIHMVESVVPRAGVAGPTPGPMAPTDANPNGADYNTAREDLQYACIYPLPASRACACTPGSTDYASCKYLHPNDCCDLSYQAAGDGSAGADYDKPICNGTTQVAAKAYPGLREIKVLHDYAMASNVVTQGNSIVASICPKDLTSAPTSPGYGYNPAAGALIDRLKEKLKVSCLPRPLAANPDGTLPCTVLEVVSQDRLAGTDCFSYCQRNLRDVASAINPSGMPSASMTADVSESMRESKICDSPGQPTCSSMCACVLPQESGANLTTCQNAIDGSQDVLNPGFCYVDPANGIGNNPDVVARCPTTQQRILRFVGNNPSGASGTAVPLAGAYVFMSCSGTNN